MQHRHLSFLSWTPVSFASFKMSSGISGAKCNCSEFMLSVYIVANVSGSGGQLLLGERLSYFEVLQDVWLSLP